MRAVLNQLGRAFGQVAALRREAYARGLLRSHGVGAPVVSVGALAMGGSGKTPVAAAVARLLLAAGLEVGVVCGGYRGAVRDRVVRLRADGACAAAVLAHGDEAVMLSRWLQRAVVVAGRDKLRAARLAVELGAEVVVVDDGFQHQRLRRDLDILVHDGQPTPLPFPAGLGREPPSSLWRADIIWHHRRDGGAGVVEPFQVASRNVPLALVSMRHEAVGAPAQLAGLRVWLMAGIACPSAFEELVRLLGARVVGRTFVRDHGRFGRQHFRRAAKARPDLLLCTEKDLVRMTGTGYAAELVALACTVQLTRGESHLAGALEQVTCSKGYFASSAV